MVILFSWCVSSITKSKLLQGKRSINHVGVINKVRLLNSSNFWPYPPLFVPVRFTCTPTSSTYVCFSELPPPSQKYCVTHMNFRMKNREAKREKRLNYFVNSASKKSMFFTLVAISLQFFVNWLQFSLGWIHIYIYIYRYIKIISYTVKLKKTITRYLKL